MDIGIMRKIQFFKNFWPENYSNWKVMKREINNRIAAYTSTRDFETIDYSEEDWDNMIILDACRYDVFEELNSIEGNLEKVHSNASHTWKFLKKNFRKDQVDTVYVTATPMCSGYGKYFSKMVHVWEDNWDKKKKTVKPEKVTEEALRLYQENSDKKMIVHYMQPHYPFISETGQEINSQGSFEYGGRSDASVWEMLHFNELDVDEVKKAYRENLELVLPEVKELTEKLEGKTVVTSDHGNLLGKKVGLAPNKIYGHPPSVKVEELRAVPWLEIKTEERRNIEDGESGEEVEHEDGEIKEKLADLGYT